MCHLDRDQFERRHLSFDKHVKEEHNVWDYLFWFASIADKPVAERNFVETYGLEQFQQRATDFFPKMVAMTLSRSMRNQTAKESGPGMEVVTALYFFKEQIEDMEELVNVVLDNQQKLLECVDQTKTS